MSTSVLCGQAALVGLPKIVREGTTSSNTKDSSSKHNRKTEDGSSNSNSNSTMVVETIKSVLDVGVPKYLHADKKRLKGEPDAGMEVFKLSKVRMTIFF